MAAMDGEKAAVTRKLRGFIGAALLIPFLCGSCPAEDGSPIAAALNTEKEDFATFYLGRENLLKLGIGLAGAGILANTSLDREIQEWYQEDVRSSGTDDLAKIAKIPGTAYVTIPVSLGALVAGRWAGNQTMEEWGQRSIRATVVGTPALLFLQVGLGGSRPEDGDSNWRPFQDSHGVSGHAFIGAVPFITAGMMSNSPYLKGALYGISALPGLSRINDNAHYPSQAALGWFLAWLSCDVVRKVNVQGDRRSQVAVSVLPTGGTVYAVVAF